MNIKLKVSLLFLPLVGLLAVLAVVGSVNTGRLVSQITEVKEGDIPLLAVVSTVTESQLEQVIWVERALFAAQRGDADAARSALDAFERLSAAIDSGLTGGMDIAVEAENAARNDSSRDEFSSAQQVLLDVRERRGSFENRVRELFDEGVGAAGTASPAILADLRNEERALYSELEDLRAELSSFTEKAAQEALQAERILMVLLILSAAFAVVFGMMVFPLLLLFWSREGGS